MPRNAKTQNTVGYIATVNHLSRSARSIAQSLGSLPFRMIAETRLKHAIRGSIAPNAMEQRQKQDMIKELLVSQGLRILGEALQQRNLFLPSYCPTLRRWDLRLKAVSRISKYSLPYNDSRRTPSRRRSGHSISRANARNQWSGCSRLTSFARRNCEMSKYGILRRGPNDSIWPHYSQGALNTGPRHEGVYDLLSILAVR